MAKSFRVVAEEFVREHLSGLPYGLALTTISQLEAHFESIYERGVSWGSSPGGRWERFCDMWLHLGRQVYWDRKEEEAA